jgi:prophage antirepressor-like protein
MQVKSYVIRYTNYVYMKKKIAHQNVNCKRFILNSNKKKKKNRAKKKNIQQKELWRTDNFLFVII